MLGVIILCGGLGLQSLFAWYSNTGVNLSAFFSHVVGFIVRWSGVARQPLPFFASPKKASKERRPQPSLPFGFPFVQDKKWESFETRLRLRQQSFLFPFSVLHKWQCQTRENQNILTQRSATRYQIYLTQVRSRFCRSASKSPMVRNRKWIKKVLMFERSELQHFPIFCCATLGTRRAI